MLNSVNLIGYVSQEIDLKVGVNNSTYGSFTLASTDKSRNSSGETVEKTIFIKVSASGRMSAIVKDYAPKGTLIAVSGKLCQWTKADDSGRVNTMTYIKLDNLQLLKRAKSQNATAQQEYNNRGNPPLQQQNYQPQQKKQAQEIIQLDIDDDDIPF